MADTLAKTVWDAYDKWQTAQSHIETYQRMVQEVEVQLRGFTEEQRELFTRLQAFSRPKDDKPKDNDFKGV